MNKKAQIVFTNIDKNAESIGYLQVIVANKTIYNYEIYYEENCQFPYYIKVNSKAKNLGNYLNDEDKEKVQINFMKDVWESGSQIFNIKSFNSKFVS